MSLHASASQTIGPFFHIGLTALNTDKLAPPGIVGERVTVQGHVLDGHDKPVGDAMIEIWQANAQGKYAHPDDPQDKTVEQGFKGFGRIPTDDNGMFRFTTIKPGRIPGPGNTLQAPHLVVSVFMRGLLKRLATRLYFPDEPSNAEDPILKLVPADRRATLTARKVSGGAEPLFEWNVIVQGEGETVFFDC